MEQLSSSFGVCLTFCHSGVRFCTKHSRALHVCNRPPARTYTMGVNVYVKGIHDLVQESGNVVSDPCKTHY